MAYYNWKLFLVVAAVAPLLTWVFNRFRRKLSESYRRVQESFSRVTATLAESVTGIKVTQGFNRQDVNADLFDDLLISHAGMNVAAARTAGAFLPLLELITQVFMAIVLVLGGWMAISGLEAVMANGLGDEAARAAEANAREYAKDLITSSSSCRCSSSPARHRPDVQHRDDGDGRR
jgi:ABC-type multidrug transport system fused ATPase/permease subunit